MGWLARTFGNVGTVRFEATSIDGRSFTGKMEIESFGLNKDQIEEELKKIIYVHEGIKCSTLKITGYYGS